MKIYELYKKYNNIIFYFSIITPIIVYFIFDFNNPNMLRDNVQRTFIFLTADALLINFFLLFSQNITILKIKSYFIISNLFLSIGMFSLIKLTDIINIPIYHIYNIHFIQAIIKTDNSPVWVIGFLVIFSFLLLLLNLYKLYIKNIKFNIKKQIIFYSFNLYFILLPLIWMFTHFTYVSSNWFYMNLHTKFIISLMENEQFKHLNYKEFYSLDEALNYYKSNKEFSKSEKNKLNEYFFNFQNELDNKNNKILNYQNVSGFNDWMDFVLNNNHKGLKNNIYYNYEIFIPTDYDNEALKHFIMVGKIKDNKIKIFVNYDNSFKLLKKNYIFNIFFIFYHIVFYFLFFILFKTHKKFFKEKE